MATNLSDNNLLERMDAGRQLSVLVEAGLVFSGEASSRVAFEQVLDVLKRRHGVLRGAVALLDAKSQEIRVEVSSGLSDAGEADALSPGRRNHRASRRDRQTDRGSESQPRADVLESRRQARSEQAGNHVHVRPDCRQKQSRRRARRRLEIQSGPRLRLAN